MLQGLAKRAGTTLIETVIAIAIFMIIAASGTSLLLYANDISGRISVKTELLENARIALDFMVNQLRYAEDYSIETDDGIMRRIVVAYREGDSLGSKIPHEFRFNSNTGVISFGNQYLAGYIREVRLESGNDCIYIYITTFDRLSEEGISCEPIILKGTVRKCLLFLI